MSGEVEIRVTGELVVSRHAYVGTRLTIEDKGTYVIWKGLAVILPCLPERSPDWQFAGSLGSHGGFSPRM